MDLREVVARQLLELRGDRLVEDLLASLSGHGVHMSTATYSRTEHGTRDLSVREWLGLALALEVPPVAIIAPISGSKDQVVDVTSGREMYATNLFQWTAGMEGPISMRGHGYNRAGTMDGPLDPNKVYAIWLRRKVTSGLWIAQVARVERLEQDLRYHEEGHDRARNVLRPSAEALDAAVEKRKRSSMPFLDACRRAKELGIAPVGLPPRLIEPLAQDHGRTLDIDEFIVENGIALHEWPES